ncbi:MULTISPECIES: nucleoside triphosphate pyrophosphohydrolase [Odoribacteraceae]|uniref:nucleoside triphosphate pyrophosphohydrolase n=1 Tax=Odoribacteraceae TaxID=1853231 RepID=UPI000E4A7185|nr:MULTISPECIES: nucleoside triphosphate pyrophosphohydrolase [Odoribacteraceae]MCQ4872402.1 nucleoside triphosphate pyrophosphohydrolase [Butyricimonas paravirosa]RHR82309.1 nucleoside triphosphate pyrophosphohydrolase [Odoribacter sp. AF15-53]
MEKDFTRQKEAFAELLDIMETLREKCPWDHKQTMESLRTLSVEEVYELGDAVLKNDMQEVKKELGDLIMHIVFYAVIGEEQRQFDITDVLEEICAKLRYRHPHIYGEVKVEDENDVLRNWEQLKLKEKGRHHKVLEGVPDALPALVKAYRIQDKVRGIGFDWKQKEDVWQKVREELGELEVEIARNDQERMEEEFGDFMFAMINAARLYGINPENALEKTNKKFIRRFSYVEEKANENERRLSEMTLEEMDEYWNEAKRNETIEN